MRFCALRKNPSMPVRTRTHPRDFVASLDKGLRVLLCFERKHAKLSVSEVARLTGYTPATARRLLLTLHTLDYLHSDGKRFWVSPRALLLGRSYLVSRPAPQLGQPVLDRLADHTHQSATLGLLLDHDVLIIGRSTGGRTLSVGLGVGSRLPAYCSAIGRAVLSTRPREDVIRYLSAIPMEALTPRTVCNLASAVEQVDHCRVYGWAECDEEIELGVRSIALPIRSAADRSIAALSLSVRAERMSMAAFRKAYLPVLREARDELQATVTFD
jgi:IclR family pca regulon transcriptional regulator